MTRHSSKPNKLRNINPIRGSLCCKIQEHVITSNVLKQLDKHRILTDCQHIGRIHLWSIPVISGVPQGTVLGYFYYLSMSFQSASSQAPGYSRMTVSCIGRSGINTTVRYYKKILTIWPHGRRSGADKCSTLRISRSMKPVTANYTFSRWRLHRVSWSRAPLKPVMESPYRFNSEKGK